MLLCLLLCMFSVDLRFSVSFIYVIFILYYFSEMSLVKYNMFPCIFLCTFPCLFLCTFLVGLRFDINFVRKRLRLNKICFY
ncbi:hypothetical protein Hanom_Chr07g00627461 [Helianthus anomalus]